MHLFQVTPPRTLSLASPRRNQVPWRNISRHLQQLRNSSESKSKNGNGYHLRMESQPPRRYLKMEWGTNTTGVFTTRHGHSILLKSVGNQSRTERKEGAQTNMKAHQRGWGHMLRQGLLLKHWPCLPKAIQPYLAAVPTILKTQIRTAICQELTTAAAVQGHPHKVTRLLNMTLMSPDC